MWNGASTRGRDTGAPRHGISRYVLWRADRECWWFRRAVPGKLTQIIGLTEWRRTLSVRDPSQRGRTAAEREALPFYFETNRTIELAHRGSWPPIADDLVEAIALCWWRWFGLQRGRFGVRPSPRRPPQEWAFASESDMARSVRRFIDGPRVWHGADEIVSRVETFLAPEGPEPDIGQASTIRPFLSAIRSASGN